MKTTIGTVLSLALLSSGCSVLTNHGTISQADIAAACHDANVTCAAIAATGKVDANVQKACAAVAVACAGSVVQ